MFMSPLPTLIYN